MVDRVLTAFEQWVITVGFAVATLLLFTNVVLRYVFGTGFTWVLELVQYIFAWVVLIGAAHGVKAGVHLGINILTEKFSWAAQRWFGLVAWALSLAFVVSVLWLAIQYTRKIYAWGDLTLNLEIPQWIPYLAIPIGMALMTYRLVQVGLAIWRGERVHVGRSEHEAVNSKEIEE